jgi:predicted ATPase
MIHTVEFRNFKALRHVKLDLERFTVLVGPNASGKTSILEGLYELTRPLGENGLSTQSVLENPFAVWTRGAKEPIEIALETNDDGCKVVYSPPESLSLPSPLSQSNGVGWSYQGYNSKSPDGQSLPGGILQPIIASTFLRLDARQLASPSFSREQEPRLGSDGQGLASALVYLLLNRLTEFDRLLELLRFVCPYVEGIRFNRTLQQMGWDEELVLDLQGAPDIPARMVSDGTLIVLGILTAMMGPDHPKLILLDDLDRGLHPRAQRDLVALLRKLFDQDPALQIVATTHSPYLLDELDPKEVRLMTRLDDGSVACARLDEHPDFEKWKYEMRPGELWSLFGEKWVGEHREEVVGL